MLGPDISKGEFTGCDKLIRACAVAGWALSWVAQALATTYHETEGTMLPSKEIGGPAYFPRMYDIRSDRRSAEHTSQLQSRMRTTYAVVCLKKIIDGFRRINVFVFRFSSH